MSHISYESRRAEPLYIGFDEADQQQKNKQRNGFGAAATFFGVLGLLATGVIFSAILTTLRSHDIIERPPFGIRFIVPFAGLALSGLAVFCAAIGMFKSPRKYALIGGILGLIPIAGFVGLDKHYRNIMQKHDREFQEKFERQTTERRIYEAMESIISYQKQHGKLPEGIAGNRMVIQKKDGWKNELRYEPGQNQFTVRSAGPDGEFETGDDCWRTTRIKTVYTSQTHD